METTPSLEQYERTFEEKIKDLSKNVINVAPLLCAVGIAIWWIFYGMVEIYPTQLVLTERLGLTACTVFLAVTYCKLISVGGFKSAKSTDKYVKQAKEWNEAVKQGNPYKKEIIAYATEIAKSNQKDIRTENLEKVCLQYSDYFDENGEFKSVDYKHDKDLSRSQKKIIRKCVDLRITIPEMFGGISGKFFGIKKRRTQKEYELKTDITSTIVRVIVAIFSVGMMFRWLGLSAGAVIYALFQIVLWTASGIMQRIKNFNFVIEELLPQMLENTLTINGYLEIRRKQEETQQWQSQQQQKSSTVISDSQQSQTQV